MAKVVVGKLDERLGLGDKHFVLCLNLRSRTKATTNFMSNDRNSQQMTSGNIYSRFH